MRLSGLRLGSALSIKLSERISASGYFHRQTQANSRVLFYFNFLREKLVFRSIAARHSANTAKRSARHVNEDLWLVKIIIEYLSTLTDREICFLREQEVIDHRDLTVKSIKRRKPEIPKMVQIHL